MGIVLVAVLAIIGYFVLRRRLMDRFTDPVTKKNLGTLGRYMMLLIAAFWLLLLWMSCSVRP